MKRLALLPLIGMITGSGPLRGQTTMDNIPDWQKAAGGGMAFEVASVHEDKGTFKPPSFALISDEAARAVVSLPVVDHVERLAED